ncbi:MAG: hypothetical protein RBT34_06630 [Anaerolineaceae bacterium]|jgi:hypothetical protein|nr:hypothetical protein [Anaerolineaceae bacterium]MDY0280594.1 hypothetical protein [Salinivirgaceae bacterium]
MLYDEDALRQQQAAQKLKAVFNKAQSIQGDPSENRAKVVLAWLSDLIDEYGSAPDNEPTVFEEIAESLDFLLQKYLIPDIANEAYEAMLYIDEKYKQGEENMSNKEERQLEEELISKLGAIVLKWETQLSTVVLNRLGQYADAEHYGSEAAKYASALKGMIEGAKEAEYKNPLVLDAFSALQELDAKFANNEDWQTWRTQFERIDPEQA